MAEYGEELYRIASALEKIAKKDHPTDATQLMITQKIFLGTCIGASEFITNVLNDSSLDIIKKHTELRKLVQRLDNTAQRIEQDINNNAVGQFSQSFDV